MTGIPGTSMIRFVKGKTEISLNLPTVGCKGSSLEISYLSGIVQQWLDPYA
jgi:hypothetical protein